MTRLVASAVRLRQSARLVLRAIPLALCIGPPALAQVNYTNGTGATVYGVTNYGGAPNNGAATFINNNVTGRNDILSSPGGGFLTINPVIGNNIAQTPAAVPLPLASFQIGGGNANGAFGAGAVTITGPGVGFAINDSGIGGGSASYSVSSWSANFTVGAGGFNGTLDSALAIAGTLVSGAGGSAVAASLVTSYSVNNGAAIVLAPLVLAAAGNGNFAASGGAAGLGFANANSSFLGLALDRSGVVGLNAGDLVTAVNTLTIVGDPASLDTIAPADLNFLQSQYFISPTFIPLDNLNIADQPPSSSGQMLIGSADSAPPMIPEPLSAALLGGALLGLAVARRAH